MNLKKRIYLLTPILVLCCLMATGMFIKDAVDADTSDVATVAAAAPANPQYNIDKYKPTKLKDVVDIENKIPAVDWEKCMDSNVSETEKIEILKRNGINTEYVSYINYANRYDIVEFDSHLFDYDGYEWNLFSAYRLNNDNNNFIVFKNANATPSDSKYPYFSNTSGTTKIFNYGSSGVNSGGISAKQGIFETKLWTNNGVSYPKFSYSGIAGFRENMLFNPSNDWNSYPSSDQIAAYWENSGNKTQYDFDLSKIRTPYEADFEFVYDNQTGYYTYNCKQNHAQYNETTPADGNNISKGKVELYTDTLSTSNGMVNNRDRITDIWWGGKATVNTSGTRKYKINYNGNADNRFIAPLKIEKFDIPKSDTTNDYTTSESIAPDKLENVYVKFKIKSSIASEKTNLKFQVVLTSSDPNGTHMFLVNNYNAEFEGNGTYYYKYDYDYTLTGNEQTFDLLIPINTKTSTNFTKIENIYFVPVATTEQAFYNKYYNTGAYIDFEIVYFDLGFNGNASNASFLPFHKIENSTKGELKGARNDLTGRLEQWHNYLDDSTNVFNATRSVKHGNFVPLEDVGNNDYGHSAAHFGLAMEVDFFIPANKKAGVDTNNDGIVDKYEDIKFEFNGDDDLWVFVDDCLVLDIGGCHIAESGVIDFTNGTVQYTRNNPVDNLGLKSPWQGVLDPKNGVNPGAGKLVDQYINDLYDGPFGDQPVGSSVFVKKDWNFNELKDNNITQNDITKLTSSGKHTMKIYYMERAAGASNCYISFNLPQIPEGGITVSAEAKMKDGSAVPSDFNGDGYDDDKVVVKNVGGNIKYYNADNKLLSDNALVAYNYQAIYSITNTFSGIYEPTYQLYKTSDPTNTVVNDLKLSYSNSGTKYTANFKVPVGYTAIITLPDGSVIESVNEVDPSNAKVVDGIKYTGKTEILPSLKYVEKDGDNNIVVGITGEKIDGTLFKDYKFDGFESLTIGNNPEGNDKVVASKSDYTNYYDLDIVTVRFSKDIFYNERAAQDLKPDNNLNDEEQLTYKDPQNTNFKNDFENMIYKFKISYKDYDNNYVTSALKYKVIDSNGNLVGANYYYTSSNGEFYMEGDYIVEMYVPGCNYDGTAGIKVEELTGNTNLPGNYQYSCTKTYWKDGSSTNQINDNLNFGSGSPTLEDTRIHDENNPVEFVFENHYIWNIDFITKPDDKGVQMDIDEDVKVTFENKLGEENWLDGEGSVDNDFGTGKSTSYPIAEQEN